jgi:ParB family chromosome partitioning protein
MEDKLRKLLGTKVEIRHSGTKGKIEISYYSLEDFERIIEKFI